MPTTLTGTYLAALSTVIIPLLLAALAFYLRVSPRMGRPNPGLDGWYFLNWVRHFKKQKAVPVVMPHYVLDIEKQWYPPGFGLFLSLFPLPFLEKYRWVINPALDTLQMLLLYFFSLWAFGELAIAVLATLMYALTPYLVSETAKLTAHTAASLLLTGFMLCLLGFILTWGWYWLLLTVSMGVLTLYTSKVGTQGMAWYLFALGVLHTHWLFAAICGAIVIMTLVLTGGFYFYVLQGHVDILLFWWRNVHNRGKHMVYQSPLPRYSNPDMARKKAPSTSRISYTGSRLYLAIPFLVQTAFLFGVWNRGSVILRWLMGWSLMTYAIALATTYIRPLRFLGEGRKYLVPGAFPSCIVTVAVLMYFVPTWLGVTMGLILLVLSVILILQSQITAGQTAAAEIDDDLMEVINRLRESPREEGVLALPPDLSDAIAYLADKRVLWGAHSHGHGKIEPLFPLLLRPLEDIAGDYGAGFILVDRRYVRPEDLKLGNREFIQTITERGNFLLYRIRRGETLA